MPSDLPDSRQQKKLMKVIAISAAVLIVAIGIGIFMSVRAYQNWQAIDSLI
jgi:hypothetical protein